MSKRTHSHSPVSPLLRTRATVVAVSLGASALLGTGVAVAAENGASEGLTSAAASIRAQAEAQRKAADQLAAEMKKAADAKKAAQAKKAAAWSDPVDKYTLTATYGKGGSMWASKHSGQDFAVPVGTPVESVGTGTVVKAGANGAGDGPAYGNAVVVKHSNGRYSQYAHLSKINVKAGQKVKAGQRIALSGNTGNSSGPHLHFEIRTSANYGSSINPVAFLRSVGVSL
ncbi:M23 family metallopeptidase [Streptomyces sp. E11-3]|uniref:M23 family metallopeptidase n=1 Tax=Streptomyces sp. E11-3 TaxID=3110112 RepID=UPI00397F39D0